MDRDEYYKQLHEELGQKYNLDPLHVQGIRCKVLADKKHRSEILLDYIAKYNRPRFSRREDGKLRHNRRKSKAYYSQIITFIKTATDDQWNDIAKKL